MTAKGLVGARLLVVGATGALGHLATQELHERGALLALAGRNEQRLTACSEAFGGPARLIDAYDLDGCAALAPWALQELGALDGVLVLVGVAGFGRAEDVPDAVAEHLFTVNFLCPAAVLRGAVACVAEGAVLAAATGAIVDRPMLGTADYAASKTALSCWLGVVAREGRARRIQVLDFRLPHLETGFSERPVTGSAPALPTGADPGAAVRAMVDRLAEVARLGGGA
ncbi:SDR family NAD(P)-dependent oxidoreductase [Streptomyces sp. NBC_01264]|uniref:SDR family NAD(P)-dependent oxidoreductase n=1 Tax=Streptomyces sp. NBC_01264 TaxID=2903804 RepID=UPI00224DD616|nr:SDR family NAD(P)-dependent oxidoreductase [Streptomyces sp. NBC_01264]MCX4776119.1 SDR family oxidoreductase [Streptomyces sp. NBC_01264]